MRLGTRIFICYVAIFSICFAYPIKWTLDNLRIRYLEGVEDPLADQANILAEWVGSFVLADSLNQNDLAAIFKGVKSRVISAPIYDIVKDRVDMDIYITDNKGRILFDSSDERKIGEDYSSWRDVFLTLSGKYGARATRSNPDDPRSTVLHVAAPIMVNGEIAGVLTVVKPTTTINTLMRRARPDVIAVFGISAVVTIALSFIVSLWMTRPIKRLTRYANDIREGRRVSLPKLDSSEIGEMGNAFEKMKEALEGKKYVEEYVQTLTHEIKSPVSAIRGAAELLEEDMKPEQRARFLANIKGEANRIKDIVDRMLELAALENLKILEKNERISVSHMVENILESKAAILSKKSVKIESDVSREHEVMGDSFLIHQAFANVVQNAIDFSPFDGKIQVSSMLEGNNLVLTVMDQGPGIPSFAEGKIFDKFFSLQRPDTGRKSTGLGLNFVREVVCLHNGGVFLENMPGGGARAVLIIPF